jgi:hypothetical protein
MSSVAAHSFGIYASVMRPTSPYLKSPPLAHSTTSPMACFLVVATRPGAVRNSLQSWLNPELAADPFPLLCAGVEAARGPTRDPRQRDSHTSLQRLHLILSFTKASLPPDPNGLACRFRS